MRFESAVLSFLQALFLFFFPPSGHLCAVMLRGMQMTPKLHCFFFYMKQYTQRAGLHSDVFWGSLWFLIFNFNAANTAVLESLKIACMLGGLWIEALCQYLYINNDAKGLNRLRSSLVIRNKFALMLLTKSINLYIQPPPTWHEVNK